MSRRVGPFAAAIRPFTVNGAQTLAYVNVNELLGFEVGDIRTGKKLHRVEVQGLPAGAGQAARLPEPRHRPDARRDGTLGVRRAQQGDARLRQHGDAAEADARRITVRDQPGWVTFSIDGRHAYPSTGEVFDTKTKKLVAALKDENGRQVGSEKLLEIVFDGDTPVRNGDQFGVSTRTARS